MKVAAVRHSPGAPPDGRSAFRLDVVDLSDGGLGGLVAQELACQDELVLFMPSSGGRGDRQIRGSVVRCTPEGRQYRIGVVFSDAFAAAGRHVH